MVLFVGDLSEGDLRLVKSISQLPFPKAVILGNHDRGKDLTGFVLESQLRLLGDIHCGWNSIVWPEFPLAILGARPCSAGGGFHLSTAVEAVYGPLTITQSVDQIVQASKDIPKNFPLIILAHSGPTGLGSAVNSICGRDWKTPSMDWGDKDLYLAIEIIRENIIPKLVVFGHMHHTLKRGNGIRETFSTDRYGTYYLNTASVPRRIYDEYGRQLTHFSWVEIKNNNISYIAHKWFLNNADVAYEETIIDHRDRT